MAKRGKRRWGLALALAAVASLCSAGIAGAQQVQQYAYSGTSFPAPRGSHGIAVDVARQRVLIVSGGGNGAAVGVSKFTAAGSQAIFEAVGSPSLQTPNPINGNNAIADIAVDNTGLATDGNFYVVSNAGALAGYAPSGALLPGLPRFIPGDLCGVAVAPNGNVWVADSTGATYREYTPEGQPAGNALILGKGGGGCQIDFDAAGNLYVGNNERLEKRDVDGSLLLDVGPIVRAFGDSPGTPTQVDRATGFLFQLPNRTISDDSKKRILELGPTGDPLVEFGGGEPANSYLGLEGGVDLAVNPGSHAVYALQSNHVDLFTRETAPVTVPDVTSADADELASATATLNGTAAPDGPGVTDCHFEWGTTAAYGKTSPCAEGNSFPAGSGAHSVSAAISGLTKGTTYHFRLVAENEDGFAGFGRDRSFSASEPPLLEPAGVSHITTDSASVGFGVNPNGAATSYHVEFGTDISYGSTAPVPDAKPAGLRNVESILTTQAQTQELHGLEAETTYHYRVVATNAAGTAAGDDRTFRTYAAPVASTDCPNAHERQQTGSALLLDCRAYELVSAPDTGGYDVRSDLDGQIPLPAYPGAVDKALYSMTSGTIPGVAGNPTNRGADPYVAERGAGGWSTRYVGLPSTNPFVSGPFGSPLLAADQNLRTFAFGGQGICVPCFEDGSTNLPLRLADGSLVEGAIGSTEVPPTEVAGEVRQPLPADGGNLIFGSNAQLEPTANATGSDLTIYERDLRAGTTQVVSTLPDGSTIANGTGAAELAVSEDGSRVVIGRVLSTDAAGNRHYHLYLHVGTDASSIDLTPGTSAGALFAGMSADGESIYFATPDPLAAEDTDSSVDLYRATVSGGSLALSSISTVATSGLGDTDICDPAPNSYNSENWNAIPGSATDCSVVAIGGGGGVATANGAIYFLSPEQLDGSRGAAGEPNLYLAAPGTPPQYVTTLESGPMVVHAVSQAGVRHLEDFQVTPSGELAVFSSTLPLTDFDNADREEIFRYAAAADQLDCVSCSPTEATPAGDTTLSPHGLNLSDDGRVFFTTAEALTLRDANQKKDAYEWSDGEQQLISSGTDPHDSSLLSVSADGKNAFFFTRQRLAEGDENGASVRLYTARENGGFAHEPPVFQCAASDECHGAGTQPPGPAQIGTLAGAPAQFASRSRCGNGKVQRRGRCVKKPARKHHTKKPARSRHGGAK
jgi:hypothetical protein